MNGQHQRYLCKDCASTFSGGDGLDVRELWELYQCGLSYDQIAKQKGVSSSTIKRRLREVKEEHTSPHIGGGGVVHIDVTYWGRNKGLMLAIDAETGEAIYHKWITHERKQDYVDAIDDIQRNGYEIRALVLDGGGGLDICKQLYPVQMYQYHFIAIIRRKSTLHPKTEASVELLNIAKKVTTSTKDEFVELFNNWLERWDNFLKERTHNPDNNNWYYTHRTLRSAVRHISVVSAILLQT